MALNTGEVLVSATSKAEVQVINNFDHKQYSELVSFGIKMVMEPEKAGIVQESVQQFSSSHGVQMSSLKSTLKIFISIFKAALRRNVNHAKLKEEVLELGLSEEKAQYLSEQWQQNVNAVSQAALKQTLSVNQLVDMEWKFGVTASSSEVNKVGSTFLQLKLVINKGNKMENVHMELTLPQFYSFLHEMEKARSSLEYLT